MDVCAQQTGYIQLYTAQDMRIQISVFATGLAASGEADHLNGPPDTHVEAGGKMRVCGRNCGIS